MAQRTDRDAEFAAFWATASASLGRAAWQLTGDRDAAADLLQAALVQTYLAWPRVGADGALAHARRAMGAPDGEQEPDFEAPDIPLDADHVLAEGHNALRGRRMGWTVAGLAALAVIASIVTPVLIAATIPPVPPISTSRPAASAVPTQASLAGAVWQVAGFDGAAFGPTRTMTVQFDGGVVSGFAGCNTFRGGYTLDGDRLLIEDLTTASRTCRGTAAGQEKGLLAALSRVRAAGTGTNGPVLEGTGGEHLVALIPFVPDATTWYLRSLTGTGQRDAGITLVIDGDRLSGDSGCGAYVADLVRDGERWQVSNLELTTTVRCSETANQRSARFRNALGLVRTARLDPAALTLTGPDGTLRFSIAR